MALIPKTDETMLEIFRCPACEKTYKRGGAGPICGVMHAPGDCCHYTDKELTAEEWGKISDLVNEAMRKRHFQRRES